MSANGKASRRGEMLLENNYAVPGACRGGIANWLFNPTRANGGGGGVSRPKGRIMTRGDIGMAPKSEDSLDFRPSYTLLPARQAKDYVLAHAGGER